LNKWLEEVTRIVAFAVLIGGGLVWAADKVYVRNEALLLLQLQNLEREQTRLQIKKEQDEATSADLIYLQTINRDVKVLQRQLEK